MATLVVNLGLSDVQLSRPVTLPGMSESLSAGELPPELISTIGEILQGGEVSKEQRTAFELPIISSYLKYLQERENTSIEKLIIFATRQSDPIHKKKDTYPLAEAIRKYAHDFGLPGHLRVLVRQVDKNPSNFDALLPMYQEELKTRFQSTKPDVSERLYIGLTGGTPQMNQALLVASVDIDAPTKALHKPENGPVRCLRALETLRFRSLIHVASVVKDRYEYLVIAELFADPSVPPMMAVVHHLARYALERMNANVTGALKHLEELLNCPLHYLPNPLQASLIDAVDRWRADVFNLRENKKDPRWLFELVYQAKAYFRQGSYFPMVVRLASYREQALRRIVEQLGVPFVRDGRYIDEAWYKEQVELQAYLQEYEHNGQKGVQVTGREVNQFMLTAIARFLTRDQDEAVTTLAAMEPLVNLRNQSVHNVEGISEEMVVSKLEQGFKLAANTSLLSLTPDLEQLFQILLDIASRLSKESGSLSVAPPNPYDEVNHYLSQLLTSIS